MRELTTRETEQVAGAGLNLLVGAGTAVLGGVYSGTAYAVSAGDAFSWGEFTYVASTSAASGFLIGTGGSIVAAAAAGTMKGATVLGVSLMGLGGAIAVAAPQGSSSKDDKNGGS